MSRATYPLPPFYRSTTAAPVYSDTIYWDNGVSYFRYQVRSGRLYLDQRITSSSGWSGVEGTDWDSINSW